MDPPPPPPQLHGVVIISLPPPDDPSKGKTITAFTLSDDPQPQTHHHHHHHHHHHLPLHLPPTSPRRSLLFPKRTLATLVGAIVVLISIYACFFTEAPVQLLSDPSDDGRREYARSFLFPLYPKSRLRVPMTIPGMKLGVLRSGDDAVVPVEKKAKFEVSSSVAEVNTSVVFPLRGNILPDGQYYTSIFVGNPPRPYFLDVDTGSDLTWIQCDAPCSSCAKGPHPLYKPTKGKIVPPKDSLCIEVQSNQNNGYCDSCSQCDYEIEYADHSSSMGVLAKDEMKLIVEKGDPVKFGFVFGCAYDQQGHLLDVKTDGILGLSSSKVSLPSQLASQGVINNVVGHCINSETDAGGYMFLGDDFVPHWGMTWVPTVTDFTNLYLIEVAKLSYGGQQLTQGAKEGNVDKLVFDSGSTYTYFPNEAYTNLIASFRSLSSVLVRDDSDSTLPLCWGAGFPIRSVKDVNQFFQPLTLEFGKRWWVMPRTFRIPPEGYLAISNKGNVCLGVLNGTEVHDGSTIILGDISLHGKLVVYDNVQKKIGWVQSDCAKPQRPKDFPFFF